MAVFEYKAFDKNGAKLNGQIDSPDKTVAIKLLKKQGLLPSEIKEYKESKGSIFSWRKKVSLSELEFLTSELSLLLESGVRIDKGIKILRRTKAEPALKKLLTEISNELEKGKSLSASFSAHSDTFDPLYCNLIELGEASGNLSEVFAGLADDLKFRRELQNKIISALAYPLVILFVCILSIFFIFNFIIPKMSGMFTELDNLPWYTSMMLSTSEWMQDYQWLLLASIFLLVIGIVNGLKRPSFVEWWQKASLKIPLFRKAVIMVERIRFNGGLAMMIKSGVQIDRAISLSAGNINNSLLRREMQIAKNKVKRGSLLTPALKETSLYPDFFISLLEVGEESGNLERVFDEIAKRSRREFESWTERVTTVIEPLMILFMGGFVGGVVVVMLLSMVSINDIGF